MSASRIVPRNGRRLRLLVVDDTEFVRWTLVELLHLEGYEVESAADAEEAQQLARMVRWDGVVLDVDLPGMNGLDLYARISSNNGNDHLPVIFFTARPNAALQLGLVNTPWARLVTKPCSGQCLLDALEQCLRAGGEAALAAGE